jgi:hypothetical protein
MSRIRTALTSVSIAVATVALGVGVVHAVFPAADTDLQVPNVISNVRPPTAEPGPVVPEPASTTSIGEAWSSAGSPATATQATAVPAITCPEEDSCVLAYHPNEGNGYWMARQSTGTAWVRLTMVPGWNNSFVAPITCKWYSWCVTDYYGPGHYWMARQSSGSTWVRLTQFPAGASAGSPATAMDACSDDPNQCVLPSCVTVGNPTGVCWYDGHQFPNRTICLQSGPSSMWTAAQAEQNLNWAAYQWAVNGPRIYVRTVPGQCAADGFAARQIVKFVPYTVDDGHCGLSYSMGVGYAENKVLIYMGPDPYNRCQRNTSITWAHELGHQLGLTHYAESASLMQFGTYRSSVDAWKMQNLYTGNPCGDPLYAGCV